MGLFKVPLRVLFVVPFVILLLSTNALIAVLAFNNSQAVVNDLASQLRTETTARVEQNLQDYVDIGLRIDQSNANLLTQGLLDTSNTQTATHYFFSQASQFDGVSTIEFADPQGHLIGGNHAENYIVVANDSTNSAITRFAVDDKGYLTNKVITTKQNYDARTRDWYKMAVAAGKFSWSDISPSPLGSRLDESAVMPVYDSANNFLGVVSVDVSLSRISNFLQGLKVGKTGQVFIVERTGAIVASSFNEPPYTVDPKDSTQLNRLMAANSQSPLISNAMQYVTRQFSDLKQVSGIQQLDFTIGNDRQFLQVTDYQLNGLDWLIIVVVPESDFLAQIQAHNQTTLLLVLTGLAVAVILGVLLSTWITRPIREMNTAAKKIAQGQWEHVLTTNRADEIGQLAQSFNNMARQLRDIFDTLEQRISDRTRDLQIAADVSRQITTELDSQALLRQIVTTTAKNFNLYASNIFLYDESKQQLHFAAGSNASGQDITTPIHLTLEAAPSLIARAARTQQSALANDVTRSADFLAENALPKTRAELAIPMMIGHRLLGVFDLQAETVDFFGEESLRVLKSLADQVAIAVRNAQLFVEAKAAREAAERSDKVKSQFLAAMSHELRTPLNAIINFTKFVAKGHMGPTTPQQSDALGKVLNSATHLLNLINDVLDISKIEAGALQLYIEDDINLNQELDSIRASGQALLEGKRIDLKLDVDNDLPLLTGDKQRIRQIMLNLLSNACKFTETGQIVIGAHRNDGHVILSVQDTGPGIPTEQFDLIFETFRQSETGLRHGKGTGLGLPISRRLAEAHEGRLWLESQLQIGTTFFVELPIKPEHLKVTVAEEEA
jgi:signal transduction histidine kinase